MADTSFVLTDVLLVLSPKLSNEMVDYAVVKDLLTQMSVPTSGIDFKDAIFSGKNEEIKSATSKVKN